MKKSKELELETEAERKLMGGLMIGVGNEIVRNPFSGEVIKLCPEAVALHDLIKGAEITGDYTNVETGLAIFSRNWPDEYMILLD